jgi:hypothetical protein
MMMCIGNIQDIRSSATSSSGQFDIKDRKRRKATENSDTNWNIKVWKTLRHLSFHLSIDVKQYTSFAFEIPLC